MLNIMLVFLRVFSNVIVDFTILYCTWAYTENFTYYAPRKRYYTKSTNAIALITRYGICTCIFINVILIIPIKFGHRREILLHMPKPKSNSSIYYFQNFFFLPSLPSLVSFSPSSEDLVAFKVSPVKASNCFKSSLASFFSLSGTVTTRVT